MGPMSDLYPSSPAAVPPDLTLPTPAYRRQVWAAGAGLLLFAAGYLGLSAWFAWSAWRLAETGFEGFLFSIPAFFLAAFLVSGLFHVRRGKRDDALELRPEDEPALFAFLRRIADEAGAPHPHRVFLTPDVNASVSYDVTLANLIWPTKKNLSIGLGLVNVLTLDELKAVLAQEFGHFAQRSMAVGTWVYIGQQAVGAVVARRGVFDTVLNVLSRVDIRIAWIGWIMRLVVWSVRSLLDTAFRGLLVLERGLSRQMEFQADLVAVSLTGSDSIVHALHRLPAADDACDRALAFAVGQGRAGMPVADLYAAQTFLLDQLRVIRDDPHLCRVPPRPTEDPAAHRVFDHALAQPPRMWATHPASREREENAKRRYVASTLDERPAWALFADPAATRRRVTAAFYTRALPELGDKPVAPEEESLERLAQGYGLECLKPRYRGVYVGRSAFRGAPAIGELFAPNLPTEPDAVRAALAALYPEEVAGVAKRARELEGEIAQLRALERGFLEAPGGVIRFRGRTLRRQELAPLLAELELERSELTGTLAAHDGRVRSAHRAAARALGPAFEAWHVGLVSLLHCLEHAEADLTDADGALGNVVAIATADGSVSRAEIGRIVVAGQALFEVLERIYGMAKEVELPADVAEGGAVTSLAALLGEELKLGRPVVNGFSGEWLEAAATWVRVASARLSWSGERALDALLRAEDQLARAILEGTAPEAPPSPARVPTRYPLLVVGAERPRQHRLGWWDRFQLAQGWAAGTARFGVAAAVLAPAAFVLPEMAGAEIVVHNGLAIHVKVTIGEEEVNVSPGAQARLKVSPADELPVRAETADGALVESFVGRAPRGGRTWVYNVAGADALVKTFVSYGNLEAPSAEGVGCARWSESAEDHAFEDAPREVDSPQVRTILTGLADYPIGTRVSVCAEDERVAMAAAHARLDPIDGEALADWFGLLASLGGDAGAIVRERVAAAPDHVPLARIEREVLGEAACARHSALAVAHPDDAGAVYLSARCLPEPEQAAAWRLAHERFPDDPWVGWAWSHELGEQRRWEEAAAALDGVAPKLRSIAAQVGLRRLALHRVLGAPGDSWAAYLANEPMAEYRRAMLRAEASGHVPDDAEDWRADLARAAGRLDEAVAARPKGERQAWHDWMLGASDGASPALVEAALAHLGEEVDSAAVFVATALGAREGRDVSALLPLLDESSGGQAARLRPIVESADVAAAVEAAVSGEMPMELRGLALLMGVVRLGEAAPDAWRVEARALVPPWQRPWLRGGE